MEIGIGDFVHVAKDDEIFISGTIDGIKLNRHGLERVSFAGLEAWFYMADGWQFATTEEEGEEDGSVQPE
jgi:hypothetical protein